MDLLQRLAPVSESYATLAVEDAFNWQDAGNELGDGDWYLVAFRSIRRADADEARLTHFDELAHQEAATSPGFLAGILDYVVSDEPLLIALAKDLNTKPEHIMQAHWTLSPSEFE